MRSDHCIVSRAFPLHTAVPSVVLVRSNRELDSFIFFRDRETLCRSSADVLLFGDEVGCPVVQFFAALMLPYML